MTEPQNTDDEKQRDDILRRMLKTPPKPHGGTTKPSKGGVAPSGELPKQER